MNVIDSNPWPPLMSRKQAAAYLSAGERTVSRLAAEGKIEPRKMGRCVRYLREDLDRFIEALPVGSGRAVGA